MDWVLLLPFLTALFLLLLTPDAVVAIVVGNTMRGGAGAGLLTAFGVEFGEMLVLAAVFTGLALSQEFLPLLFRWLSFAGMIYLAGLGTWNLYRAHARGPAKAVTGSSRPILDGLTIAFSNPTTLVFHTAFFPQFIDPHRPLLQQLLILGGIYLSLSLVFDFIFIAAASKLRSLAGRGRARFARISEIASALLYIGIAIMGFATTPA